MINYKIVLDFDGTRYQGWQRLKGNDNTIQGKIEDCLGRMAGCIVEISGCGRTDAGVHAKGYVANFYLKNELSPNYIKDYLNTYLPYDINVSCCKKADDRFHARLNAKKKTYVYRIWNGSEHNVFEHKYLYEFPGEIDLDKMEEATKILKGTHNFKGFCSNKNFKKSTVRTLYDIKIVNNFPEIKIEFTGNGFLYNMVRIMTGTLLEIGMGKKSIEDINYIFESGIRSDAGFTVPSKGLILTNVEY